jgi:hypothetical protein
MIDPTLEAITPELTDQERERLFGCRTPGEQADLANLFWQCETPEQRRTIYQELRGWFVEMLQAQGARL